MVQTIINEVMNIRKGTFGAVTTIKTEKVVKKSCPLANVVKISEMTGVQFGISYENVCNNRAESEYKAEAPKGMEWEQYPYILRSLKNPEQKYLRIYQTRNFKSKATYLVDGVEATEEQLAIIKEHSYATSTYCKKQAEHGIAEEDMLTPMSPKIENILYINADNVCIDTRLGEVG